MDEFNFPDADIYHHVYDPPSDPSKSILSLPTEIIVDIARLNFKAAVALMCTNRVLHAAGVTALYARVFVNGWMFDVLNADAPNLVPGVLGGLLAKQEHTAALRYLKIISVPYNTHYRSAFSTLVYRVFERAHGLVCVDLNTIHLVSSIPHMYGYLWDNFLEYGQGPYSQVTSLRYIHNGVGLNTTNGPLKIFELFPSVERIEVKVGEIREVSGKIFRSERVECVDMGDFQFLDCVPHMGNSWARIKHLSLVDAWIRPQPPDYEIEGTKRLLIGALNALCPALETGEVRYTNGYVMWRVHGRVMWVGGRRSQERRGPVNVEEDKT